MTCFPCKTTHITRTRSFPTFTIPKGSFKNFPNGNIRLRIYDFILFVYSTHANLPKSAKKAIPPVVGSESLLFIFYFSKNSDLVHFHFGPWWSKVPMTRARSPRFPAGTRKFPTLDHRGPKFSFHRYEVPGAYYSQNPLGLAFLNVTVMVNATVARKWYKSRLITLSSFVHMNMFSCVSLVAQLFPIQNNALGYSSWSATVSIIDRTALRGSSMTNFSS